MKQKLIFIALFGTFGLPFMVLGALYRAAQIAFATGQYKATDLYARSLKR